MARHPLPDAIKSPRSVVGSSRRRFDFERTERSNKERGTVMGFIVAIVIGGVIGWLASLIMKTNVSRCSERWC